MEDNYELQVIIDKMYSFMTKHIKENHQKLKIDIILTIQIIKKESKWNNEIFLIALKLLQKIYDNPCQKKCSLCCPKNLSKYWLEFYLISLLVSQKMYDDFSLSNKKILNIYLKLNREYQLDLEVLNVNEIYFMKHLEWNLFV